MMDWVQKMLNKCSGLRYRQEYLCLATASSSQALYVYLLSGNTILKDVSHNHLFTGYSPLIFAFYFAAAGITMTGESAALVFTDRCYQPNDSLREKDAIARISLKKIGQQSLDEGYLVYYEGIQGKHKFLSPLGQHLIGLHNRLYHKKAGNVFLRDNLYKQVQIAYSLPRIISLITVSDGRFFNLFPTDLHGPVGNDYYIISLRHQGKACSQVEQNGRVLVSEVSSSEYRSVYALGKNHMQELRPEEDFPFGHSRSQHFQLPLPKQVVCYRELELVSSIRHGIHQLLLFQVRSQVLQGNKASTLAHIHQVPATWLRNKGLPGNYLLR